MTTPFGITGSTGNLGGRIARLMASTGTGQRLIVRDPSKAPSLPGTSTAEATYGDLEAVRRALDGLTTVLMVSASESENRLQERRSSYGAPDWQVDAWVGTYTAIAAGELSGVTGDVERVSGRPATSLEQLFHSA